MVQSLSAATRASFNVTRGQHDEHIAISHKTAAIAHTIGIDTGENTTI
jgi:hypothetical protein